MRSDLIRLHAREHYVDLHRSLSTDFGLYADAEIDAGELNARVAALAGADPFSVLLIQRHGPRDFGREAFLRQLAEALGADRDWRIQLDEAMATAPVLDLPPADLMTTYATALPAFLTAESWLDQVVAIMSPLDLDAGAPYADFRLAADIAAQLSPLLGYQDATRAAAEGYVPADGGGADWGAGYTGGASLFVDLFAKARGRADAARIVATRAEALPPRLLVKVYGWLLNPGFEYYLGVGPTPDALPPGIARIAPTLAALHADLVPQLMAEFASLEVEMTAG